MIKNKDEKKILDGKQPQSQVQVKEGRASARLQGENEDNKKQVSDEAVRGEKKGKKSEKRLEKELKDKLQEFEQKEQQYIDRLQRLQAEFENYRKRVDRERSESWTRAKSSLVLNLLPILDDFNRVSSMEAKDDHTKAVVEGMQMVEKKLHDILKEAGLVEMDALGNKFDPNFHEALMTVETDDPQKDDTVSEVLIKGYMFEDRLLRPSRVKVLKYDTKDEDSEEDEGVKDENKSD